MVPFSFLLSTGDAGDIILQFDKQYYAGVEDACFAAQSPLESLELETAPSEEDPITDRYDQDCHDSQPSSIASDYYVDQPLIRDSEPSCSSFPLCSLSADEVCDGKESIKITERARVAFSKQVECFHIDTLDTYTDDEVNSMWYSLVEMKAIRNDSIRTVRMMFQETAIDEWDGEVCFRGLEHKTGLPFQARQKRKALTRKNVLDEQAFYLDLKVDNPEAIAEISRQHSTACVKAAIDAATRDHSQDCDQWKFYFDEEEFSYSNQIFNSNWLHAALPIVPKLSYFNMFRNNHRTLITI